MTVKPLTKEQKLEIVSKAIDAGAHIQVQFHTPEAGGTATPEEAKIILQGLGIRSEYKHCDIHRHDDDYKFEGTVYYPTPKEWQDSGDMEEVATE